MVNCGRGCENNWDVRCCCEPNCKSKNIMKQFNHCKQKTNTLHTHIFNDYDIYKMLEAREIIARDWHRLRIKKELYKTPIYEVVDDIFKFSENVSYLTIGDIREAVSMLSKKITISNNECQEIIDMIIEDLNESY